MDGLFTPVMELENPIPAKEDFLKFSLQYQQMIMRYETQNLDMEILYQAVGTDLLPEESVFEL